MGELAGIFFQMYTVDADALGADVGAGIRAGQCWAQLVKAPVTRRQTVQVVTEDGATKYYQRVTSKAITVDQAYLTATTAQQGGGTALTYQVSGDWADITDQAVQESDIKTTGSIASGGMLRAVQCASALVRIAASAPRKRS